MKIIKYLLAILVGFNLTSCVVSETVNFNADNSGKINYKFDMSKMMQMAGGKMGSESSGNKKDVDSTFTMASLYASKKDSIAKLSKEEQEKFKKMEKFTCRMVMKEAEGIFQYEMFSDFKNPTELQDMISPVNSLSDVVPNGKKASDLESMKNNGVTRYAFDGKKFSKQVTVKPKEQLKEDYKKGFEKEGSDSEEAEALANQMTQSMEMVMTESSYEMTVTFPKKIKKVSAANAKISEDKKSVTISYPMKDYMESKNLNFEIETE